ncbi:hypothetical protein QJS10_CPA02g01618 [Acorus calamus]|uniref:Uncharacterized protein n=1 Tax=Acorus calamus TaxID=4465 RepID=A0AAV9FDU5_ACOCL|nr:hypothetical protein QJS10_CPA02g01618 [Acorus calamus]
MQVVAVNYFGPKNKTAKLSAERKERIMLPGYADDRNRTFPIVQGFRCTGVAKQSLFRLEIVFAAFMRNHITWDSNGPEPCLDVDVKLDVTLQVYTQPFNLLPISMVEVPGNL